MFLLFFGWPPARLAARGLQGHRGAHDGAEVAYVCELRRLTAPRWHTYATWGGAEGDKVAYVWHLNMENAISIGRIAVRR